MRRQPRLRKLRTGDSVVQALWEETMALRVSDIQPLAVGLTALDARELATLIARGEISALEAVDAHIERIERVNGALNAVVVKRYDAARVEAREADRRRIRGDLLGPLHGVPMTIKECL